MIFRPVFLQEYALQPSKARHCNPRESYTNEIVSNQHELRISVDLPGVKRSDVSLTIQNGTIRILATRRHRSSDGSTTKTSLIESAFSIDEQTLDLSKTKANLSDEVLVVAAPKKARPEPLVIDITEESSSDPKQQEVEQKEEHSENDFSEIKEGASKSNDKGEE